ncbi:hypothetical protein TNCV_447221 [Trichonephila clavipes]|nr:hypothetical protein TNCV_447221 [Trichonephila clavipes]
MKSGDFLGLTSVQDISAGGRLQFLNGAEIVNNSDTMVERECATPAKSMTLRTADAIGGVWQSAVRLASPEGRERKLMQRLPETGRLGIIANS